MKKNQPLTNHIPVFRGRKLRFEIKAECGVNVVNLGQKPLRPCASWPLQSIARSAPKYHSAEYEGARFDDNLDIGIAFSNIDGIFSAGKPRRFPAAEWRPLVFEMGNRDIVTPAWGGTRSRSEAPETANGVVRLWRAIAPPAAFYSDPLLDF